MEDSFYATDCINKMRIIKNLENQTSAHIWYRDGDRELDSNGNYHCQFVPLNRIIASSYNGIILGLYNFDKTDPAQQQKRYLYQFFFK